MEIKLNSDLVKRLKSYQQQSSFKNFDELIEYILSDFLDKTESRQDDPDEKSDKQKLNERLKNLGYL